MIVTSKRFFKTINSLSLMGNEYCKKLVDIINNPQNYDFIKNHGNYLDLGENDDEVTLIYKKNIKEDICSWNTKSRVNVKITKLLKNLVNPYEYSSFLPKELEKLTSKYKLMATSVKKSSKLSFNRNKLNRLLKIVGIQSYTNGEEELMDNYLINFIRGIKGITYHVEVDDNGNKNFFITKGKTKNYPCVVAHKDTVHKIIEKYKVYNVGDTIFAIDGSNISQYGTGGDDKVGIFVALQLLLELPILKVAFFHNEEIGQVGSYNSNKDFFSNVGYVLQADRKGNSDIVRYGDYTELFSDEQEMLLKPLVEKFGYNITYGSKTDVIALKRESVNVLMLNASCGYHKPHTKEEVIQISEVFNTIDMFKHLIKNLGNNRYEHSDKFKYDYLFGDIPLGLDLFKSNFKCSECKQKPFKDENFTCTKCNKYEVKEEKKSDGKFLGEDVLKINVKDDVIKHLETYKEKFDDNSVRIVNILLVGTRIGYLKEFLKDNYNNFISFSKKNVGGLKFSYVKQETIDNDYANVIIDPYSIAKRKASGTKEMIENIFEESFLKDMELKDEDYIKFDERLSLLKSGQTQIEFNKNLTTTND
jgi:hypothetical protein